MPSTYDYRLIQAGMKIEIIEYEKPVIVKDKNDNLANRNRFARIKSEKRKESASALDKMKNREIVLYRARNEVRRLINANVNRYCDEMGNVYKPVFLTLTFADNIQDVTEANREFRKFIKRLGTYIAKDQAYVKHVAVPEFQRRGAVHYHVVIFNLPFIKASILESIWSNGFIKIKSIEEVDNIGAYISKYMTKSAYREDRLIGQKCCFRSRNIYEPMEIRVLAASPQGQQLMKKIETMGLVATYNSERLTEHYGIMKYSQYKTNGLDLEGVIQNGKKCTSIG